MKPGIIELFDKQKSEMPTFHPAYKNNKKYSDEKVSFHIHSKCSNSMFQL